MQSAVTMGLVLVGISAVLHALLWQQWQERTQHADGSAAARRFRQQRAWRRLVANSLVGFVGVALIVIDLVPRTPLSMTAYLMCLVLSAAWIMWLGWSDWRAYRRFRDQQQLAQLAKEMEKSGVLRKP